MKLIRTVALAASVILMVVGCGKTPTPEEPVIYEGEVVMTLSTNVIRADGKDTCRLTVTAGGHDVSDVALVYDAGTGEKLSTRAFTSTSVGTYVLFADYYSRISEKVSLTVAKDVPSLPADPAPTSTAFSQKVMGLQFTGTGCPNCPYMIAALQEVMKTDYAAKMQHVAIHSYNIDDIMYNSAAVAIGQAYGSGSYPNFCTDMRRNLTGNAYIPDLVKKIEKLVDDDYKGTADAGVCASAKKVDGVIIVRVAVKAGVENKYKVGTWLLEDGIHAVQSGWNNFPSYDFSVHDNAVMAFADSYSGVSLGTLAAGESTVYTMMIPVQDSWKIENCKLLVFVSAPDAESTDQKYYVHNLAVCPLDGSVAYSYNK